MTAKLSRVADYRWRNCDRIDRHRNQLMSRNWYGTTAWVRMLVGIKPPMPYAARRKPVSGATP